MAAYRIWIWYTPTMRTTLLPSLLSSLSHLSLPAIRQVPLWIALGLLLASLLHGYWLLSCILLVGVIMLFVLLQ